MLDFFLAAAKFLGLQGGKYFFASIFYLKAFVVCWHVHHFAIKPNHLQAFKIVTLPYLKVVRVVRRGNFYGAGAVFWVDVVVSNYGNFAVRQW